MPLFGKKQETAPAAEPPPAAPETTAGNQLFLDESESIQFNLDADRSSRVYEQSTSSDRAYGVGDLIRLLKTLPINHPIWCCASSRPRWNRSACRAPR